MEKSTKELIPRMPWPTNRPTNRPIMDIIEAEPLLGKSRNRIYGMIQRGDIPPEYVLHIGDRVYLHRETFTEWLSGKNKVKAK